MQMGATFGFDLGQDKVTAVDGMALQDSASALKVFGVPWEPWDFVDTAKQFLHPLAVERVLPEVLKEAVHTHQTLDALNLAKLRLREAYKWNVLAKQLQGEEDGLKASMDPEVRSAVAGKRIVLFEKMLEASEFPDKGVSQELRLGANLVGEVPTTGVLPGKFVPATMTQDALEVSGEACSKREVVSSWILPVTKVRTSRFGCKPWRRLAMAGCRDPWSSNRFRWKRLSPGDSVYLRKTN